MSHETILWIVFAVLVPVALGLDLGVFQRQAHKVKIKEALLWSVFWFFLALLFALGCLPDARPGKGFKLRDRLPGRRIFKRR